MHEAYSHTAFYVFCSVDEVLEFRVNQQNNLLAPEGRDTLESPEKREQHYKLHDLAGKLALTADAEESGSVVKQTKQDYSDRLPAPSRRLLSILNLGLMDLDMFEDKTENRAYQLTHEKLSDMRMSGVELMLLTMYTGCVAYIAALTPAMRG